MTRKIKNVSQQKRQVNRSSRKIRVPQTRSSLGFFLLGITLLLVTMMAVIMRRIDVLCVPVSSCSNIRSVLVILASLILLIDLAAVLVFFEPEKRISPPGRMMGFTLASFGVIVEIFLLVGVLRIGI